MHNKATIFTQNDYNLGLIMTRNRPDKKV